MFQVTVSLLAQQTFLRYAINILDSLSEPQTTSTMPKHIFETKLQRGHLRTRVTLRQGEVISLCRCWKSANFPLCDGSHKQMDGNQGPVMIETDCSQPFRVTRAEDQDD